MVVDIQNKKYAFDIDKMMKWVSSTPKGEKNIDITITHTTPVFTEEQEEIKGSSVKEITESKSVLNDTMNQIRYDFMKMIVSTILGHYSSIDGTLEITPQQQICLNTLKNKGILVEIK